MDGIITQNIDRLHQKAGSLAVVDLHGTYAWVVCTSCRSRCPREEVSRYLDELNPGFYDGMDSAADELDAAVETVLDDGWRTVDIADERTPADHVIGTTAMGDRIVEAIRAGSPSTRE